MWFIVMNKVNSKHQQISRGLINFQGISYNLQGVSSAFEMAFQIPAAVKERKDLQGPCELMKMTCGLKA